MTYLDQRKQLFEDKLADGYYDHELELEVRNLSAHQKIFEKITAKELKDDRGDDSGKYEGDCQWCGEDECVCPECGCEQDRCKDETGGHCEDCDPQNSWGFIYG